MRCYAGLLSLSEDGAQGQNGRVPGAARAARRSTTSCPRRSPRSRTPAGASSAGRWDVVGIDTRWDMVPYDVQLIGGIVLHQGKIAEMATGEGKTLVATHAALPERADRRRAPTWSPSTTTSRAATREWMGRDLQATSASPSAASRTRWTTTSAARPTPATSPTAPTTSSASTTCATTWRCAPEHRVQRGHAYAIVDEVDSVLIDEARTPLIISGPVEHSSQQDYGPS